MSTFFKLFISYFINKVDIFLDFLETVLENNILIRQTARFKIFLKNDLFQLNLKNK